MTQGLLIRQLLIGGLGKHKYLITFISTNTNEQANNKALDTITTKYNNINNIHITQQQHDNDNDDDNDK